MARSAWTIGMRHRDPEKLPRRPRTAPVIESLEGRTVPSAGLSPVRGLAAEVSLAAAEPVGVARKVPSFYEHYTGPKSADLNVVAVSARLYPHGGIALTGATDGKLRSVPQKVYVFGIDRGGVTKPGPFPGRPNIRFDATVVVTLKSPPATPTAMVTDLKSGKTTTLPQDALFFGPRSVRVLLGPKVLPSTGSPPSGYRVVFWARSATGKAPNLVASFVPEAGPILIGIGA